MKVLLTIIAAVLCSAQIITGLSNKKRVVCYYDAISWEKEGDAFTLEEHLQKALPKCTHLVYSFAQILPQSFEILAFKLSFIPSDLKAQFPHLKIFLSVGGDNPHMVQQFLTFLEAGERKQRRFIENIKTFLKLNRFDGLDLAFPLPRNKPRKVHSNLGQIVKKFKKLFTGNAIVDLNAASHKLQFTQLVQNIKKYFAKAKLQLSLTVLPNVNSTWYFDVFKIQKNFEFINLFAFDFLTPERNPEEADYSAPLYFKDGANRLPHYNIDFQVNYWIHNGCPVEKLNLGIATYGRAWKLTIDSGLSGTPVVENTYGSAEPGSISKTPGLLNYAEICIKLKTEQTLRKVVDETHKYGDYAFRPADHRNRDGIWISYDDPEFAGIKTEYVKQKLMGGVAVFNLNADDFLQLCMGPVFPILSRISEDLQITNHMPNNNVSFLHNNLVY